MTAPKSSPLSWDIDGDTAQSPSQHSRPLEALAKPGLYWGEDACTVARPADESLPPAAFKPMVEGDAAPAALARLSPSAGAAQPDAPPRAAQPDAPPRAAQPELLPRNSHTGTLPDGTPFEASARAAHAEAEPTLRSRGAQRGPPARQKRRRPVLRGCALALTMLVFYAGSYTVVSVSQKLRQRSPGPLEPSAAAVWSALGEVFAETRAKWLDGQARAPGPSEAPH